MTAKLRLERPLAGEGWAAAELDDERVRAVVMCDGPGEELLARRLEREGLAETDPLHGHGRYRVFEAELADVVEAASLWARVARTLAAASDAAAQAAAAPEAEEA